MSLCASVSRLNCVSVWLRAAGERLSPQVHLQTQQQVKLRMTGMALQVVRSDGVLALYNGLSASLCRQVPRAAPPGTLGGQGAPLWSWLTTSSERWGDWARGGKPGCGGPGFEHRLSPAQTQSLADRGALGGSFPAPWPMMGVGWGRTGCASCTF